MNKPKWIEQALIERLHDRVIDIGGGSRGLRDAALLESALARPQNLFAYGESDIFELAAAYAEGIASNHPFIDGNKRTAFQTADLFLALNGYDLSAEQNQNHADIMVDLVEGRIGRDVVASHLRIYSNVKQ